MLKTHNSLTREKQDFTPIEPGKMRMYVCGRFGFCGSGFYCAPSMPLMDSLLPLQERYWGGS